MMNKRIRVGIQKIKKPTVQIKFSLGTIALIAACLMLLVIATFTQIKLNFSLQNSISSLNFKYIPQIPAVIFISAFLGLRWGVFTVLLYVILGLTPYFPIYGLGGGLSYIFEYSFGYIVSFIFAAFICAKELKNENSIFRILTASLYGVFTIHLLGILYMTIIALLRHDSWSFIYDLIFYQSLSTILYDLVFSIIAIIIAKILKKLLWIII